MKDIQSHRNIYFLQKKIVDLTREYYNAIRSNITFENIKVIFMKRKKLREELTNIKEKQAGSGESEKHHFSTF